ncbi:NADP-dependent isocitrate dehydrogenase [Hippea alviniae]|uniref:NADP-dependent isocitrate dehydrogenase n=1 Tax=Hippea alviniae TaxID=1279027 RepID=UPI0003B469B8|nr:NADP-dependent isocitrate dehydrogenase [Hippea alviniae]
MAERPKMIWTKTDEAPYLASFSLYPIVKAFVKHAGVDIEIRDISLAGRILATFPDYLKEDQKVNDDLAYLGELVNKPEANVIKLPNISASVVQLKEAIKELQSKGYNVPDYPEEPKTEEEKKIQERYAKVLGSAVNPVLRQGNSDRRLPNAVKEFAKKYPDKMGLPLKPWPEDSKSHVAHMESGDFYENEKSVTLDKETDVEIQFIDENGNKQVIKKLHLLKGEVLDGTFMSAKALRKFYEEQVKDAKEKGVLLSLHLKATMMKVSDPILFGHMVEIYFKDVFEKHKETFEKLGVNPNNGLVDLYKKIEQLDEAKRKEIEEDIQKVYEKNPDLAMVDSRKGITNLHAPNLIIIDASMPPMIRDGGKMWNKNDELQDTKAIIPDRSYARMYKEIVEDCKRNGQFDRTTMGDVSNVGLMAMKAEEYGSHDKTFEAPANGTVRIVDADGNVLIEHKVEKGDIWRACQVKDEAIKDWVGLAVRRAKATGDPAVFWLDENRAHDAQLIKKVKEYLPEMLKKYNAEDIADNIKIMPPVEAMRYSLERIRKGENTISVTGNVLRDYLTDLFPILEVGTSAKMLSIVPLLAGGGLFETGAGGSAPKHAQQLIEEGHLRWDSLGEFGAIFASLEHIAEKYDNKKARIMADAADKAMTKVLENQKWPGRKVHQLDSRGEHFYFAMYWAESLAEQNEDEELKKIFEPIAKELKENEEKIIDDFDKAQGAPCDIDGYYWPDESKIEKIMRCSETFNSIIDKL